MTDTELQEKLLDAFTEGFKYGVAVTQGFTHGSAEELFEEWLEWRDD